MTWEPMTEDAVFGREEWLLVRALRGYDYEVVNYHSIDGRFYYNFEDYLLRSEITHFARITNPNEEQP